MRLDCIQWLCLTLFGLDFHLTKGHGIRQKTVATLLQVTHYQSVSHTKTDEAVSGASGEASADGFIGTIAGSKSDSGAGTSRSDATLNGGILQHASLGGHAESAGNIASIGTQVNVSENGGLETSLNIGAYSNPNEIGLDSTVHGSLRQHVKGSMGAEFEGVGVSGDVNGAGSVNGVGSTSATVNPYLRGEFNLSKGDISATAGLTGDASGKIGGTMDLEGKTRMGVEGVGVATVSGSLSASGTAAGQTTGSASVSGDLLKGIIQGQVAGEINGNIAAQVSGHAAVSIQDGKCGKIGSLCGDGTLIGQAQGTVKGNAKGQGELYAGLGATGAQVNGSASVSASASVSLHGEATGTIGHLKADASGIVHATASAYAEASGEATATIGLDKSSFGAKGSGAAVSAQAKGQLAISNFFSLSGEADVSYGYQVGGGGGVILNRNGCTFKSSSQGTIAALAGGSFAVDVAFNPCKAAETLIGNAAADVETLVSSNQAKGDSCVFGTNCAGFSLTSPGLACCNFQCTESQKGLTGYYGCPDRLFDAVKESFSYPPGAKCLVGVECQDYTLLGEGAACCEGVCTQKKQDWAGMYYCPNIVDDFANANKNRAVGESCGSGIQCDGFALVGAGNDCCNFQCATKKKDWAGLYYCPNVVDGLVNLMPSAVVKFMAPHSQGSDCTLGAQCEGYTLAGEGTECCQNTCQERMKDYAGLWWCPILVRQTTNKGTGEGCALGSQCSGYTSGGAGAECCWFQCQNRKEQTLLFGIKIWVCP